MPIVATTSTRKRRPRLTRRRIAGLQKVADLADSSVWSHVRSEQHEVKTALQWIRDLARWRSNKEVSTP